MEVKKSNFQRLLEKICEEEDIRLESFSYDWAHRLTKDGRQIFLVGYQFPLNNASAKELCQDKALTYGMLTDAKIPAAVHIFLPTQTSKSVLKRDDEEAIIDGLLKSCGEVVLKDNSGTGGNRVYRVKELPEAMELLDRLCEGSHGAALCPFYEIEEEYRVVMLDHEPQLVIRKERKSEIDENGNKHYLNWKHNLGQGATGFLIDEGDFLPELFDIAKRTTKALNIRFCSVDIVRVSGKYMVLEVNAGVMMEHLSGQSPEYFERAKGVYKKAVLRLFDEASRGEKA